MRKKRVEVMCRSVDGVPEKRCTECLTWKPATLAFFHKHRDGLHTRCKPCNTAAVRACQQTQADKTGVRFPGYSKTKERDNERTKALRRAETAARQARREQLAQRVAAIIHDRLARAAFADALVQVATSAADALDRLTVDWGLIDYYPKECDA